MRNPFDLTGRVALVTGGNGGIGFGMAQGLAGAGATVVIAGRNEAKNAAAVARLPGAAALVGDVTVEGDCRRLVGETVARCGALHVLVNNAGTNIRKPPQEMTLDEWRTVIDTNLTSAFLLSHAAYPALKKAGQGKIINIGSMASLFGMAYASAYAASKGGIVQLTKALAAAWARDAIAVNAVLPGWIDTDLTRDARQQVPGLHDRILARTPAGRWGVPEDLSGIAVFLASAASDFVTGAAIPVDGGYAALG
jgi:2-dehydro-3-deoxy-D-gluconate 5-dehydrogenase